MCWTTRLTYCINITMATHIGMYSTFMKTPSLLTPSGSRWLLYPLKALMYPYDDSMTLYDNSIPVIIVPLWLFYDNPVRPNPVCPDALRASCDQGVRSSEVHKWGRTKTGHSVETWEVLTKEPKSLCPAVICPCSYVALTNRCWRASSECPFSCRQSGRTNLALNKLKMPCSK